MLLAVAFSISSIYGDGEIAKASPLPKECVKPVQSASLPAEAPKLEAPKLEASNAQVSKPTEVCEGSFMVPDCCLPCDFPRAYNEAARIDVTSCNHDMFAYASFIYWHVSQEYMDIGRTALFSDLETPPTPARDAKVPTPSFSYHPGFKVGAGFSWDKDNWQLEGVYTRMYQQTNYSTGTPIGTAVAGNPIIIPNEWWLNLSEITAQQAATMSSKWTMNMDLADLLLSRPFYLGRCLVLKPYTGLSALFIRQKYHIDATFPRSTTTTVAESNNWSHSWAIGPSAGANFLWLLSYGVRIEADVGMRLFYEKYSHLRHRESFNQVVVGAAPLNGHMPVTSVLRPVTDMALGLGWGRYFKDNHYHVDFEATYEFALFAHENMMRQTLGYLANNPVGYSNPIGDLFLHGLTVTGRVDF